MIRKINADELESLLPLAADFHIRCGASGAFNAQAFMRTWDALMKASVGTVMARFVGGIPVEAIGYVTSGDMLTGDVVSHVLFWMFPERDSLAGGMLYRRVLMAGRESGSRRIAFQVPEQCGRSDRFKRLLRNSGFVQSETIHIADL